MRRKKIGFAAFCAAVVLIPAFSVEAAPRPPACAQIRAACQRAGFVEGGAKAGNGIQIDCIRPIMEGAPPRRAGKPLPPIDPEIVAACRMQNPNFGRGNPPQAPAKQPPAPRPPEPPPPDGPPEPAPTNGPPA